MFAWLFQVCSLVVVFVLMRASRYGVFITTVSVVGYDAFATHDLQDASVNAIVPNLWNVINFHLRPIMNDDLFRIIQNGSVCHLFDSTPPTVIVHWCVSHVSLYI